MVQYHALHCRGKKYLFLEHQSSYLTFVCLFACSFLIKRFLSVYIADHVRSEESEKKLSSVNLSAGKKVINFLAILKTHEAPHLISGNINIISNSQSTKIL